MNFSPLTLTDRSLLTPAFSACPDRMRDFTFASLYMWAEDCAVEWTCLDGVPVIRSEDWPEPGKIYAIPATGEDFLTALRALDALHPEGFLLRSLDPANLALVEAEYGARASVLFRPEESDYLYRLSDLATYPGRKYSAKRNHVNAFLRERAYVLRTLTPADLPRVRAFYESYRRAEEDQNESALCEGEAAWRILDRLTDLDCLAWYLESEGQILGFAIGEVRGDTLYLHIEKALAEVRGAYPLLVREVASQALSLGLVYENREEDDGDEGLRRSKESYHPCFMVEKARAVIRAKG